MHVNLALIRGNPLKRDPRVTTLPFGGLSKLGEIDRAMLRGLKCLADTEAPAQSTDTLNLAAARC